MVIYATDRCEAGVAEEKRRGGKIMRTISTDHGERKTKTYPKYLLATCISIDFMRKTMSSKEKSVKKKGNMENTNENVHQIISCYMYFS